MAVEVMASVPGPRYPRPPGVVLVPPPWRVPGAVPVGAYEAGTAAYLGKCTFTNRNGYRTGTDTGTAGGARRRVPQTGTANRLVDAPNRARWVASVPLPVTLTPFAPAADIGGVIWQ